ncbi:hypothetical protein BDZ89DRAFT_1087536 [Hymenopellis radicata]|nr:hypothetical protein BDZ89DRAFT_1087536 [Hymenopellis radicata]
MSAGLRQMDQPVFHVGVGFLKRDDMVDASSSQHTETVDLDSDEKEEPDRLAGLSATRIVPAVPRATTADLDDDFPSAPSSGDMSVGSSENFGANEGMSGGMSSSGHAAL